MPIIELELPDGRIAELEVDEGVSEQEILKFAEEQYKAGAFGVSPDVMTKSQNQPRSAEGRDLLDVLGGYGETALTMGTGAIAEPVAGLAAMATMPFGADPAKIVEGVREGMTYQPRTEAGQAYLQNVGETLAPVGEALMDASQYLGDKTFDLTGSPLLSTAAYSAPTAILELLGLKGIQRLKSPVKLKTRDVAGNWKATPELENMLRDRGLIFDQLDPNAKAAIPEILDPKILGQTTKSKTQPAFVEQIKAGGRENALAPYVLEAGKATADPLAQAAIKQGFDEGLVQAIKTTTPATRFNMLRMLGQMERIKTNQSAAGLSRPIDVVGNSLAARIKFLDAQRQKDVARLNTLARTELKGVQVNAAKVVDDLAARLAEKYEVRLFDEFGNPNPDFTRSYLSKNTAAQKALREAIDILKEYDSVDAADAHRVKKVFDELVDYKKSSNVGQMTKAEQDIFKTVRKSLNQIVRDSSPEYAQVNDRLTRTLEAFDNLQQAAGKKTNLFDDTAGQQLGQESRKLLTNYNSRIPLSNAMKEIDDLVASYGGEFSDNLYDQVMFASNIDDMFGAAARDSFKGTMQNSLKGSPILGGTLTAGVYGGPKGAATQAAVNVVKSGYDKMRGVNQDEAFKAMRALLRGKY